MTYFDSIVIFVFLQVKKVLNWVCTMSIRSIQTLFFCCFY